MKQPFSLSLSLPLLIALMMFPQVVETIYSPALIDIAAQFKVSENLAGQTLSLYFLSFAVGIVVWGYAIDRFGRRGTMMIALMIYFVATLGALISSDFTQLLFWRMLMAFSAAIGSIGTQTVIRDRLSGVALQQLFSTMGIALAVSPILGLFLGVIFVSLAGYQGVFLFLMLLAIILIAWVIRSLPETKPAEMVRVSFIETFKMMIFDLAIWRDALLIAGFNITLFAYYQLAPFLFEAQGLSTLFGVSGIALGIGAFLGAYLNRYWIKKYHWSAAKLLQIAAGLLLLSTTLLFCVEHQWFFFLPMIGVTMAYSIAIPNILTHALNNYRDRLGSAGALLGLLYYILIGLALIFIADSGNLGVSLMIVSLSILAIIGMSTRLSNQ